MYKASITEDGRLQFPKAMLREHGYIRSTKVHIAAMRDKIILTPVEKRCALCHTTENMIEGFPICRACGEKVRDVMNLE